MKIIFVLVWLSTLALAQLNVKNDSFCDPVSGPPCDGGTPVILNRTFFRSDLSQLQAGKNAWVSINHKAGVGTVRTNQDRTLWLSMANDVGDIGPRYSMVSLQAETVFNAGDGFKWVTTGGPDKELAGGSFQLADRHTGSLSSTNFGQNAVMARTFRISGIWGSCPNGACWTGVYGLVHNSAPAINSGILAGVMGQAKNIRAERTQGDVGIAGYFPPPAIDNRFQYNWGVYVPDYGADVNDWGIRSIGRNYFGSVIVKQSTPANSNTACIAGAQWNDANFVYVCTSPNHVKRANLTDF